MEKMNTHNKYILASIYGDLWEGDEAGEELYG